MATATVLVPITTAKLVTTLALPSRVITTGKLRTNTIAIGIKVSRDAGTSAAIIGNGTKPRVISGIRDAKDTGTRKTTACVTAVIGVMSMGGARMAGSGVNHDKGITITIATTNSTR